MLTSAQLAALLARFPTLTILVVGDFFLDHYLILDARLTEVSLETGLDAYQVVAVRPSPGAAGTVTNNLRALGVRTLALGVIGDDGNGFELERALRATGVDTTSLLKRDDRFTPTYTKPLLRTAEGNVRELNRLDIKNRVPLPRAAEEMLLARLEWLAPRVDGIIAVDQVEEEECGVITTRLCEQLAALGQQYPAKIIAAESRTRIAQFRQVRLQPNTRELLHAFGLSAGNDGRVEQCARELYQRAGRTVFVTRGEQGIWVCEGDEIVRVPTVRVTGPLDTVGAGDSALAAISAALCAGADAPTAALVGNLAASVTIRQIGTTGVAPPAQILATYDEWQAQHGRTW